MAITRCSGVVFFPFGFALTERARIAGGSMGKRFEATNARVNFATLCRLKIPFESRASARSEQARDTTTGEKKHRKKGARRRAQDVEISQELHTHKHRETERVSERHARAFSLNNTGRVCVRKAKEFSSG